MPNVVISLTPYWKDLLDELVKSGAYATRSELVRASLLVWYEEVFYKSKGLQQISIEGALHKANVEALSEAIN